MPNPIHDLICLTSAFCRRDDRRHAGRGSSGPVVNPKSTRRDSRRACRPAGYLRASCIPITHRLARYQVKVCTARINLAHIPTADGVACRRHQSAVVLDGADVVSETLKAIDVTGRGARPRQLVYDRAGKAREVAPTRTAVVVAVQVTAQLSQPVARRPAIVDEVASCLDAPSIRIPVVPDRVSATEAVSIVAGSMAKRVERNETPANWVKPVATHPDKANGLGSSIPP